MASQAEENMYELPNIQVHTEYRTQCKGSMQEEKRMNSNSKSQKICVCLFASLFAAALLVVAGTALMLAIIQFEINLS